MPRLCSVQATRFQYNVLLGYRSVLTIDQFGSSRLGQVTYPSNVLNELERVTFDFQNIIEPLHEILFSLTVNIGRILRSN